MRRAVLVLAVALLTIHCVSTAAEEERERRSVPNRTLARAIDDVASGAPADAFRVRVVGAESLDDGLRKIASGELPAEALRVSVQQRGDAGFLLQIRGGDAIARRFAAKSGFGASGSGGDEKEKERDRPTDELPHFAKSPC